MTIKIVQFMAEVLLSMEYQRNATEQRVLVSCQETAIRQTAILFRVPGKGQQMEIVSLAFGGIATR